MTTKYTSLPAAQRAADRGTHHTRMMREWHEHRIRQLEDDVRKSEIRLEEAREAFGVFEAKGVMAERLAKD